MVLGHAVGNVLVKDSKNNLKLLSVVFPSIAGGHESCKGKLQFGVVLQVI